MRYPKNITKHKIWLRLVCLLVFGTLSEVIVAQAPVTWDTYTDIEWSNVYDADTDTYWLVPDFGPTVEFYQGEWISMEGYFIEIDQEQNIHVLSMYPYSACFFCGAAGPESIVEIQLTHSARGISMDQRIKVSGRLKLNADDYEHFNLILTDAEISSQ